MNNNNPLTEIFLVIVSALLVIGGVVLLYLGKIDTAFASSMFILAAGLLGVNGALKVPSAGQQTQINTLQQGLQDLISLFASHTHPVPPTPPSAPTQPVQAVPMGTPNTVTTNAPIVPTGPSVATQTYTPQFVPDPNTSLAAYQTGMMPAMTPPAVQP